MSVQPGSLFSFPASAYAAATNLIASIHTASSPSSGCGSSLLAGLIPGAPSTNISISSPLSSPNSTLQNRQYRIHLPANYPDSNDKPRPLLLIFNGQYQSTASIENYTKFSIPDFNPNAVAVYPEGILNQWLGDPAAPNSSYINDVQFVSDVLDDLESKFCIDKNRIYGAGLSNGGGLTALLRCSETVGKRFAALAGVAAAYYLDSSLTEPIFGAKCSPKTVIPYMEIHGDVDKIIAYNGDNSPEPNTFPIPTYLEKLAKLSNCSSSASFIGGLVGIENNSSQVLNSGNVTKSSWTCGGLEDVLVHYKIKGLGHGWPSTFYFGGILDEYRNGPTSWNASAVIGEWFGKWTLRK